MAAETCLIPQASDRLPTALKRMTAITRPNVFSFPGWSCRDLLVSLRVACTDTASTSEIVPSGGRSVSGAEHCRLFFFLFLFLYELLALGAKREILAGLFEQPFALGIIENGFAY